MKALLSLFLLAAIPASALAELPWQLGLGFHDPKSEQAPEGVRRAADSIFQIVVVTKWAKISLEQFEKIPATDEFQHLASYLQSIDLYMLSRCREKHGNDCYYPIDLARGTGFLAGDRAGKRLWTNAHVAIPAIKAVYSTNSAGFDQAVSQRNVVVPLFIFDRNGKLVGNVVDLTATYVDGPKESEIMGAHFQFDYVELQLNRSLGSPIPIANKRDVAPSAPMYAVGFPTCTRCGDTDENAFPRKEYGESDGVHQYLSVGVEIEASQDLLEKLYQERAPLMQHVRLTNRCG